MSIKVGSIVIGCHEFDKMLGFGRQALHYVPREPRTNRPAVLRDLQGQGPNLSLHRVSEKRSGKRRRLHLDLYTNRKAEVERLTSAGATRHPWRYEPGSDFAVLQDPDGNLFCLVEKADA